MLPDPLSFGRVRVHGLITSPITSLLPVHQVLSLFIVKVLHWILVITIFIVLHPLRTMMVMSAKSSLATLTVCPGAIPAAILIIGNGMVHSVVMRQQKQANRMSDRVSIRPVRTLSICLKQVMPGQAPASQMTSGVSAAATTTGGPEPIKTSI